MMCVFVILLNYLTEAKYVNFYTLLEILRSWSQKTQFDRKLAQKCLL